MKRQSLVKEYLSLPVRGKVAVPWRLVRDPRVPWYAKLMLPLIAAYLLMPIDLVPDFIPVLGQLDDLLMVTLGLGLFFRLCPPDVVAEHVRAWCDRIK